MCPCLWMMQCLSAILTLNFYSATLLLKSSFCSDFPVWWVVDLPPFFCLSVNELELKGITHESLIDPFHSPLRQGELFCVTQHYNCWLEVLMVALIVLWGWNALRIWFKRSILTCSARNLWIDHVGTSICEWFGSTYYVCSRLVGRSSESLRV